MRNVLRKIHLILGLTSGLVVLIVSITGCIYAFEEEIRTYLYHDLLFVNHENVSTDKIDIDRVVDVVKKKYPKAIIKNIRLKNNFNSSIEIILKNKESIYVNPYTVSIISALNKDQDFFSVVLKIHRSLYLGDIGKIITGTSALIFIFLIITGIIIWWPRTGKRFKYKFIILKNTHPGRRVYDLHSVLGFYASLIIIFTAVTGVIWSFKWAENGLYMVTNSKKTDTRNLHSLLINKSQAVSLNRLVLTADTLCKYAEEYFISMPDDSGGVIRFTARYDHIGFFTKYDQLFFDQYNNSLIKFRSYESLSLAEKIKAKNYNIHTGKIAGITGQLLVFFASLITASLPVTGFIFWRIKK